MADDQDNPDDRPVGSPALARADPPPDTPSVPAASPASTPGFFDSMSSRISGELAPLQERKAAAMDKVREQTFGQADRDMATARRAFEATSYSPNDMKPWNQQEQSRKFSTDPIQAFGSAGSVFAMIASAFTHAPMENALNGAAAAMNAVRAGDEREYERAYASWKDNTNLAIKRHQMEREKYQDAVQLMQTNMGLGRAKMEAVAASFNDQKMLFLARNGMDSEVFDLMKSRASTEKTLIESSQKIEEHGFGMALLQNDPLFNITEDQEPDPYKRAALKSHVYQRIFGVKPTTPEAIAIAAFTHDKMVTEHRDPTGEELAKLHDKFFGYGARPKSLQQQQVVDLIAEKDAGRISEEEYNARMMELMKEFTSKKSGSGSTASKNAEIEKRKQKYVSEGMSEEEAYDRAAKEVQAANAPARNPATRNAEIEKRKQQYVAEGMPEKEAYDRAAREIGQANTQISGNKRDQLQAQVGQYEIADKLLNRSIKTLETHVGAAGVAGKVTRMAERVENILGSNRTDREQFERDISQLQLMSTRLLLDQASGRPLSAEASKIQTVIAGLRLGDTTANTLRALREIREQFRGMEEGVKKRIEGAWKAPETPAAGKPAGGAGLPAWKRGVLVQPAPSAPATAEGP